MCASAWIHVPLRQGCDYAIDGVCHDLLGTHGFLYAIRQILRVKEGGLSYWGLPCNSFSAPARATHGRSSDKPFGNHHGFVVAGNILATRMVALIMLALVRQVKFMVEQPDRSMAIVFPYIQHLMAFPQVDPQRVFWCEPHLKQHGSKHSVTIIFEYISYTTQLPCIGAG